MAQFDATLEKIGPWTIIRVPQATSGQLPSRGMVMVRGSINGYEFQQPLEPDGKKGHWLRVNDAVRKGAKIAAGDTATLDIEPTKDWPEPDVPQDVQQALNANEVAGRVWHDITPMARWDWLRWIGATKNPATRLHRIEVTCSKLNDAKRRPCCFNRTACTDPSVSKNGILLDPA